MKYPLKLTALIATLLALATIGAVQGFNLLAGHYRDQVQQELQKVLGKDVAFAGLEVTLLGGPGFVAKEFRVADDPRFAATPLLRAKGLVLGISLWDLLFQRLVITTLAFNEPEFQIISDESGARNVTSLLRRKDELRQFPTLHPAAPERKRAPVSFSIREIRVKEGRIEYVDRSLVEPAELRVRRVTMRLKGFHRGETTTIHFTASLTEGLSQDVRVDGRLDPAPSEEISWTQRPLDLDLRFDALQVPVVARAIAALRDKLPSELDVTGPMALQAKAAGTLARPRLDNITLKIPLFGSTEYNAVVNGSVAFSERRSWHDAQMRGQLTVEPLALARLRTLKFVDQMLSPGLLTDGTIGLYARFEGTRENLRIGALVRAAQADLRFGESLRKRAGVPAEIKARLVREKHRTVFHDSQLTVASGTIDFSGIIDYSAAPRFQLRLVGKRFPMTVWKDLVGPSALVGIAGTADADVVFDKGWSRDDWTMRGGFSLSGAAFRANPSGHEIKNVNGAVRFAGKGARVDRLSFRLGRSPIVFDGATDNLSEGKLNYTLQSAELNLIDLPLPTPGPPVQLKDVQSKGQLRFDNEGLVLAGSAYAPQARLRELSVRNVSADIVLGATGLKFKNFSAQTLDGVVRGDGYWGTGAERTPRLELSSAIDALQLRALIAQWLPPLDGKFEGRLNGRAQFDAAAVAGVSLRDALKGSGEASVRQGVIKNFNLVGQLLSRGSGATLSGGSSSSPLSGLADLISSPDTPFDSLSANFVVGQRRISTDSLVISTPDYTITGAGWVGFDRTTQWNGSLIFSPRLTQELQHEYRITRYLLDRRGRLTVSFRLDGKIPDLKIRLENRALAQALRAALSGRGEDKDADAQREPKEVKRWIPDAIERFLKR